MEYRFGAAMPDLYAGVRGVWSVVYNRGAAWETEAPAPGDTWYVAWHGDRIVWAAEVGRGEIYRSGFRLSCGRVALVGTVAEARGLGTANRAMADLNRAMKDDGLLLAALYPYREVFYAKSGYARCGWRWQIKAPRDRMPKFRAELEVRELPAARIAEVAPCYDAMAHTLSGSFVRSADEWTKRLGRRPEAIYAAYGPSGIEGYFWARPTEFWGWLNIGEFAWSTHAGYTSCLATIRGLAENQEGVTWCEPPESPFLADYIDQGIEATRSRATMFQVLDPGACLRALPRSGADYVVEVEGAGSWQVGRNGVESVTPQPGAYQFTGAEFTQAFLGAPSVLEHSRRTAQMLPAGLAEHLVPSQTCCMDFF